MILSWKTLFACGINCDMPQLVLLSRRKTIFKIEQYIAFFILTSITYYFFVDSNIKVFYRIEDYLHLFLLRHIANSKVKLYEMFNRIHLDFMILNRPHE